MVFSKICRSYFLLSLSVVVISVIRYSSIFRRYIDFTVALNFNWSNELNLAFQQISLRTGVHDVL